MTVDRNIISRVSCESVDDYVKKNNNQALVLQMGKQSGGLKPNGMVSKSTTNDLDNFN